MGLREVSPATLGTYGLHGAADVNCLARKDVTDSGDEESVETDGAEESRLRLGNETEFLIALRS